MAVAAERDAQLTRMIGYSGHDIPDDDLLHACVHCGMCLPACPTYRLTGQEASSPRGRLWMMKAVAEERLDLLDPTFDEQMYQCLNCRACEAVCPSGVHYGPLVEAARSQLEQHRRRPIWQRWVRRVAMDWLFADMRRFRAAIGGVRFYQRSGLATGLRKSGLLRLLRVSDLEQMLPPLSRRSLVPGAESWIPSSPTRTVQLFNGCVMSTIFADINRAAARVMAHNDTAVALPVGQQCCGALQVHAGMMEEARALAKHNIEAFEHGGDQPIVVTAAGCGAVLKEYSYLFREDARYAKRATRFSERVRDVTEFLGSVEIKTPTVELPIDVTYQEPCHLAHAQRVSAQPRSLLGSISGLNLIEMRESSLCCGSAGIYNLIRRKMADDLGDRKARHVLETGAEVVVTANPGCAMQLRASLRRNGSSARVRYIVDMLDEAYGGANAPLP